MNDTMSQLLAFLNRLGEAKISYRLEHNRDEAIMVLIAVPGQRWEVEFLSDGRVEVEVFTSDGRIQGQDAIERLFREHADDHSMRES